MDTRMVTLIPQCSTGGQISCDAAIYHIPIEHWRSARASASSSYIDDAEGGMRRVMRV